MPPAAVTGDPDRLFQHSCNNVAVVCTEDSEIENEVEFFLVCFDNNNKRKLSPGFGGFAESGSGRRDGLGRKTRPSAWHNPSFISHVIYAVLHHPEWLLTRSVH
jgi:hypothetical protein